jgi:hypothetical protein
VGEITGKIWGKQMQKFGELLSSASTRKDITDNKP